MILYPVGIFFMRRRSDGKLYRGAKFWRWTKSWRRAAALPEWHWIAFALNKYPDSELVTLEQLIDEESTTKGG